MLLGIEIMPNVELPKLLKIAKKAETNGFDIIWVTDHYNNRELFTTLTYLACNTEKVLLGAGVANIYTRAPLITLSAIETLNEISGGRAVLGLGPGDKVTLEKMGIRREKPVRKMRETIKVIRDTLKDKRLPINYQRKDIKIYIGAQGIKMLGVARELADGVLVNGSHERDIMFAREIVGKNIDVAAYTVFSIDEDSCKAKDHTRIIVAYVVAGAPRAVLERHGVDIEVSREIGEMLTEGRYKEVKALITDEMVESFAVAGDKGEVKKKIRRLEKAGATQIVVGSPIGVNKERAIDLISEIV